MAIDLDDFTITVEDYDAGFTIGIGNFKDLAGTSVGAQAFAELPLVKCELTVHVKSEGGRYHADLVYFKTAESEGHVYHPRQKPVELGVGRKGRLAHSSHSTLLHRQWLRSAATPSDGRTNIRMARQKPQTGQRLGEINSLLNGADAHSPHPHQATGRALLCLKDFWTRLLKRDQNAMGASRAATSNTTYQARSENSCASSRWLL